MLVAKSWPGEVFDYFVNRMVLMAKKLGKQTILWDVTWQSQSTVCCLKRCLERVTAFI